MEQVVAGAGFIIYKIVDSNFRFLGLIGPEELQQKYHGIFDIPKGHIDPGEEPIDAALRELFEETSIVLPKKDYPSFQYDGLRVFVAHSETDPIIVPNPESGNFEHTGFVWLSPESLASLSYNFLNQAILTAKNYLPK